MEQKKALSHILQVLSIFIGGLAVVSALVFFGPGRKLIAAKAAENRIWAVKSIANHGYDAVVIGDSRAYRGFDPAIFESETGLRTINLGYSSAGFTEGLLDLAERHLDPKGAKVVILAVTPYSLTETAGKNQHLKLWTSKSRAELLATFHLSGVFGYFSPEALKSIPGAKEKNPYHQKFYDNGFVFSRREIKDVGAGAHAFHDLFQEEKVSDRVMTVCLQRVGEWKERGFRMIAYRPPVDPGVWDQEELFSNWDEDGWRDVLALNGIPYFTFENEKFESYDGSHLTGESAQELTREIAARFKTFQQPQ